MLSAPFRVQEAKAFKMEQEHCVPCRRSTMGVKRRRQERGRLPMRRAPLVSCLVLTSTSAILSTPAFAFTSYRPAPSPVSHKGGSLLQYSLGLDRPLAVSAIDLDRVKARHLKIESAWTMLGNDCRHCLTLPIHPTASSSADNYEQQSTITSDLVDQLQETSAIPYSSKSHATTISSSSSSRSYDRASTIELWKRRLVTREDWKHLHKTFGLLFLLSSWGLTGYAISDFVANGWTIPVTRHGRPFLALLWTLVLTSVAQSFSSVSMACRHRRGQPAVRNTFLCNAAVAILGSVSALWTSSWYPAVLNGTFSKAFYLIMNAIGLIGMGDNLLRLNALITSRQETNKKSVVQIPSWRYWKDVFVYMMPILIGAPFFVAIGWQFGIRHDRIWYLNLLQQHPGHAHLKGGAVYGMIMVAMGASYSSLIVTLRDKKLIRKRTEGLGLTAVMLCLVGSLYQAMRDPGTVAMIMGM
jgi:hypothetical protein